MTRNPVLSIIVPTRNRARYAIPCIRSLLDISSKALEIVVQDNSDDGETGEFIKTGVKDERLVYRLARERLDVVENFVRGLEVSSGTYITFIGDDDGVNPELIDAAFWANSNDVDALTTSRPAQYRWPDKKERIFGYKQAGELTIKPFTGTIKEGDPEAAMRQCAKSAGENAIGLPKIYYGLARRDRMEEVKKRAGTYFPGLSPDLAGAVALANYIKNMRVIDYPLFIPGASAAGVAGWIASGRHQGRLEDYPHLPQGPIRRWSSLVPRYFAGNTIWGEDVVQALTAVGREDILRQFNVPLLHAKCAVFNPPFARTVLKSFFAAMKTQGRSKTAGSVSFFYHCGRLWLIRGKFLIRNMSHIYLNSAAFTIKDLPDIFEATRALKDHLRDRGRSFA